MRELSELALRSAHAQETDEVWLLTLKLDDGTGDPLYLVNNNEDVTSNGNLHIAFPFEFDIPGDANDEIGEASIVVDNVDRRIVDIVRRVQNAPDVIMGCIFASDPDHVEFEYTGLKMRDVEWDAGTVRFKLRYENILVEPISHDMTPSRFPSLF